MKLHFPVEIIAHLSCLEHPARIESQYDPQAGGQRRDE